MITRRSFAATAAALATTVALGLPAVASAEVQMKFGWTTSDGAKDPYAIGARAFKAAVEKLSNGEIKVALFPNRQLGDEKQMLEGLKFGTVDGAIITNAVIAQVETAFQINDLPFLYANEAQAQKVLDGEVGQMLADKLAKKGVIALGFMEGGYRQMINNKQPVKTPADVQGVKYRVMQNPTFIDMFNSLGGAAVPMAWGETFTAVQQGTVDGLEIPLAVIDSNKYYEVTKFLSLTNHTYSMIGLVVSKRWFNKLPKNLQAAVVEAGKMATAEQRKTVGQNTQAIIDSLKSNGMQINQVSDPAAFRTAVQPMYKKARDKVGSQLMDATMNAVQQ